MKVIILDGARFTNKSAAHEYIAASLNFPTYYGKNLDALDDCLSELPRDTAVVITNAGRAKENLGAYADGILDDFRDVLGERFCVCIFE
ncbi:MAG: barstar family protein [Clostridia bacterium]|nr:barstar family protein [Clostridia bacterium]